LGKMVENESKWSKKMLRSIKHSNVARSVHHGMEFVVEQMAGHGWTWLEQTTGNPVTHSCTGWPGTGFDLQDTEVVNNLWKAWWDPVGPWALSWSINKDPKALAQHLRPREPKNWLVSWRWT
jgi:hypothetical protein